MPVFFSLLSAPAVSCVFFAVSIAASIAVSIAASGCRFAGPNHYIV